LREARETGEILLVPGDALLVLELLFHALDCVARLNVESDGLACQGLDEYLHAAAESEHEVQRRLLCNVVIAQRAAVLELLAREDQPLLVRGDALLVLDLLFHALDCVARLDVKSDGLTRQGLDEDLHLGKPMKAELVPCSAASQGVCCHQFYHHQARFDEILQRRDYK